MRCEHWFKFDGVCKHCGYQKPIPDLGLIPLRTKAPQANRAGGVKPIIPVMRTALEQIQELHAKTYWTAQDEVWELNAKCNECHAAYPCETRKLADAGLAAGGGERG